MLPVEGSRRPNENQIQPLPHEGSESDAGGGVSGHGSPPMQLQRDTVGDLSFSFNNFSISNNWV